VQLVDEDMAQLGTQEGLASIAEYADVVGVHKNLVIPRTDAGSLGAPVPLVDAHALGLAVHAFTFRDETAFLPVGCDGAAECVAFLAAGVDGLFADHPDTAVSARDHSGRHTTRLSS